MYTLACMCARVSYMWVNNAHMEENRDYVHFVFISFSSGSLVPRWLNNVSNTCSTGKVGYKAAQLTWSHPEHCIISSRSKLSPNQPRPCLKCQMFCTLLLRQPPLSFKCLTCDPSALDQEGHLECCQHIWFLDIIIMEKLMPFPFLTLR